MSVSANDKFDNFFFVIVAYWEGRQIQNQPSIGSLIKFQNLASGKSEPGNQGVIALMMHDLLELKKAWFIIFVAN